MLIQSQTKQEQQEWCIRASIWMNDMLPKIQHVNAWSEMPPTALEPAKRLALSVLGGKDLVKAINSNAYKSFPGRAVANLAGMLSQGLKICEAHGVRPIAKTQKAKAAANTKVQDAAPTAAAEVSREGAAATATAASPAGVSERAEHIADYLHMLPSEVAEQTASLKEKYLELADLRAAAEHAATDEERAEYANRALTCDQQLRQLFVVIDMCVDYYEKNGIVISLAELHTAKQPETREQKIPGFTTPAKDFAKWTKAEIDALEDPAQQEYIKGIRIKANQRYLRRVPGDKGAPMLTPEWAKEVKLRAKELEEWGESTGGKIAKAIKMAESATIA